MATKINEGNGNCKRVKLHHYPYGLEAGKAKYTILYFGGFRRAKTNKWETHFSGRIK